MKKLQCGNIELNNKQAKICVPITGSNEVEILKQAKTVSLMKPDMVEWRADYYNTDKRDEAAIAEYIAMLEKLHEVLGEIPIIFTFRTKNEGGEKQIDFGLYSVYCKSIALAAKKNNVAFVDIEAYEHKNEAKELIDHIHYYGAKVIGSNHHFDKTPSEEEMIEILSAMEQLGADVCKLAVMPQEKEDVSALISASKRADKKLQVPVITMSMGELGAVTRICTGLTGSVITFAAGTDVSAPGQIPCNIVRELDKMSTDFHIEYNIVLIGFMGTGKTTISKALSRITGLKEVDVDKYIVEKERMEITDIFEQKGEAYFRNLETQALREVQKTKGKIISCGGGAVLKDENVDILKDGGKIVLLTATPETIFERVKDQTTRPVLNRDMSIEHVTELMQQRNPRYEEVADIKVNVDSNDRVRTCYDLLKKLEENG